MNKDKMIFFRLQQLDYEQLRKIAIKQDLPVSTIITRVLKKYLAREIIKLNKEEK